MGVGQRLIGIWNTVSNLGITPEDTPYFSRKIALSNQLGIIVLVIGFLLTLGFTITDIPVVTARWFFSLLLVISAVPFLNRFNFRVASRHILCSVLPMFLIFFVAHVRSNYPTSVHEASFYIPRFFLLAIGFLPPILFGFEERKHLFIALAVNLLLLLFYNDLMDFADAGMGIAEVPVKDPFFISISTVFSMLIVSGGYVFLSRLNQKYELRIEQLLNKTEAQNRSMQDAVNYAKNIQQVVLPNKEVIDKLEGRMFVLYKPLHTVSGDFYMVEETDSHILFSVIDCTGHGVPGAFMSILASSALQRAVNLVGLDDPALVMHHVSRLFHEDLEKSGNPNIRDGMDMAMCSFNKQTKELKAAGANIPIYHVSNSEIEEHRTDKGGISIGSPDRTFTTIGLKLNEGDQVYIGSDGYQDQFGGPRNKKIGKRQYREKLLEVSSLPMHTQHKQLTDFYIRWKGDTFQVDDVCLIGFLG